MEAAGLALGVVSLGLDLATRLQTYIEGVQGAGDRLSEITAQVSATASIVRQLADLLDADQATSAQELQRQKQPPIFTAKGISEIEATLRRCNQAYNVLVTVLVSATSESFSRTQKALATAGLGDLTAARLARLTSRVKWPWLEPRIKACQKQLKSVKVDLLLSLHIASLAKHRNSLPKDRKDPDEEDDALRAIAENLLAQRADNGSLSPKSPPLVSPMKTPNAKPLFPMPSAIAQAPISSAPVPHRPIDPRKPSGLEARNMTGFNPIASSAPLPPQGPPRPPGVFSFTHGFGATTLEKTKPAPAPIGVRVKEPIDAQQPSAQGSSTESVDRLPAHHLKDVPGHGECISIASLASLEEDTYMGLEGWFFCRSEALGTYDKIAVRGPSLGSILQGLDEDLLRNTLPHFLSLASGDREAIVQAMDSSRHADGLARNLVAIVTASTLPVDLLQHVYMLAIIAPDDSKRDVVNVVDITGGTWPVPYHALKTAVLQAERVSDIEAEVLRRCDLATHGGQVMLFNEVTSSSSVSSTPVSFATLRDIVRPGLTIRLRPKAPAVISPFKPGMFGSPQPPVPNPHAPYPFKSVFSKATAGDDAHNGSAPSTTVASAQYQMQPDGNFPNPRASLGFGSPTPETTKSESAHTSHGETSTPSDSGLEFSNDSSVDEDIVARELFGDEVLGPRTVQNAYGVGDLLGQWTTLDQKDQVGDGGRK